MKLDWLFILAIAIVTIGALQWAKSLLKQLPPEPGKETIPSWVWAIAMPVLAVGLSLLFSASPSWVSWGALAFALAQLGYENIVKLVQRKIDTV